MARNEKLVQVREFIRQPYAWPGGYPQYLVMSDGECLCQTCAKENYRLISGATRDNLRDGWQAEGVDINWESDSLYCAHCNKQIESAYGEPDQ